MHNNPKTICTHLDLLTKKTLLSLPNTPLHNTCQQCQQQLVHKKQLLNPHDGRICLHCCGYICSPQCSKLHTESHTQKQCHVFSMGIDGLLQKEAKIYCKKCEDRLVTDYEKLGDEDTERENKLFRFLKYVNKQIVPLLHQKLIYHQNCYEQEQILYADEQDNQNLCGLYNLGNTCYMNSIIQILHNTPQLKTHYLQTKWGTTTKLPINPTKQQQYFYDDILQKDQQNRWHIVSTKKQSKQNKYMANLYHNAAIIKTTKFNQEFSRLMEMLEGDGCVEPAQFLCRVSEIDGKYGKECEQDAEEFLYLVLDCLTQGEMLKINNRERYEKVQAIIGRQKLTHTQKIFTSYFANHIICQKCKVESWKLDLTYGLSVPISTKKTQTQHPPLSSQPINNLPYYKSLFYPSKHISAKYPHFLQPLFTPQKLTYHSNYWICQKCEGMQALKLTYLLEQPQILIVSFKRFDHRYTSSKKNEWIQFQEVIDISGFCLRDSDEYISREKYYKIAGVIVHVGKQMSTGHYISYVKKGKQWYKCSDDKIQITTWNEVKKSQAYILFYKKITIPPSF